MDNSITATNSSLLSRTGHTAQRSSFKPMKTKEFTNFMKK